MKRVSQLLQIVQWGSRNTFNLKSLSAGTFLSVTKLLYLLVRWYIVARTSVVLDQRTEPCLVCGRAMHRGNA